MPHVIRSHGGFAIHGTLNFRGSADRRCRVASAPSHAAVLFALVERNSRAIGGSESRTRQA